MGSPPSCESPSFLPYVGRVSPSRVSWQRQSVSQSVSARLRTLALELEVNPRSRPRRVARSSSGASAPIALVLSSADCFQLRRTDGLVVASVEVAHINWPLSNMLSSNHSRTGGVASFASSWHFRDHKRNGICANLALQTSLSILIVDNI